MTTYEIEEIAFRLFAQRVLGWALIDKFTRPGYTGEAYWESYAGRWICAETDLRAFIPPLEYCKKSLVAYTDADAAALQLTKVRR
jgi:hypothetical protein